MAGERSLAGRGRRVAALVVLTLVIPEFGGAATCRAAPPESATADTRAQTGPRVHIDVRGPGAVALYRLRSAADQAKVCDAPCDAIVDAPLEADFVVDGPRMSRSLTFSLAGHPSTMTIRVRPGFRGLSIAGWVTLGLGAAAVLGGGVMLTVADDARTLRRAGGVTLLSGLPLLAGGGIMAAFGPTRFRLIAPGG